VLGAGPEGPPLRMVGSKSRCAIYAEIRSFRVVVWTDQYTFCRLLRTTISGLLRGTRRFCGTGFQPVTGHGQDGRATVGLRLCRAVFSYTCPDQPSFLTLSWVCARFPALRMRIVAHPSELGATRAHAAHWALPVWPTDCEDCAVAVAPHS
jgi:hypothetical protein